MVTQEVTVGFCFEGSKFLTRCRLRLGERQAPCHYCGSPGNSTHLDLEYAKGPDGIIMTDELELLVLEEVLRGVMMHGRPLCSRETCWFQFSRQQTGNCQRLDAPPGTPIPRFTAVQIAN